MLCRRGSLDRGRGEALMATDPKLGTATLLLRNTPSGQCWWDSFVVAKLTLGA